MKQISPPNRKDVFFLHPYTPFKSGGRIEKGFNLVYSRECQEKVRELFEE